MNCRLKRSNLKNGEVVNIFGKSRSRKYSVRWENGETVDYFSRVLEPCDDDKTGDQSIINQEFVVLQDVEYSGSNDDSELDNPAFDEL